MRATGTGADAGPGGAMLRLLVEVAITDDDLTPCEDAVYQPAIRSAITTATATSTITNAVQGGTTSVTLAGRPFSCSGWVVDGPASLAGPSHTFDVQLPLGLGTVHLAEVLRLNDQ